MITKPKAKNDIKTKQNPEYYCRNVGLRRELLCLVLLLFWLTSAEFRAQWKRTGELASTVFENSIILSVKLYHFRLSCVGLVEFLLVSFQCIFGDFTATIFNSLFVSSLLWLI